MLEKSNKWGAMEDFAALFQYLWHRNFPMDERAIGARTSDWTIHIGIVIRNIADLMGLYARFEAGRTDAVLRNREADQVALEWEWGDGWDKELNDLKNPKRYNVWSKKDDSMKSLQYAVLVTYVDTTDADTPETEKAKLDGVYKKVSDKWMRSDEMKGAPWPLLLILIDWKKPPKAEKYWSGRKFKNIQMSIIDHKSGERRPLRAAHALPWEVEGTRWVEEALK
ncbi:MAG: hypothetical protein AAB502_07420 [Chloroflexota bacterium]